MQHQSVSSDNSYTATRKASTTSSGYRRIFSTIYFCDIFYHIISIKSAIVPCLQDEFDSSNMWCDGLKSFSRHLNSLPKVTNMSSKICRKIEENLRTKKPYLAICSLSSRARPSRAFHRNDITSGPLECRAEVSLWPFLTLVYTRLE